MWRGRHSYLNQLFLRTSNHNFIQRWFLVEVLLHFLFLPQSFFSQLCQIVLVLVPTAVDTLVLASTTIKLLLHTGSIRGLWIAELTHAFVRDLALGFLLGELWGIFCNIGVIRRAWAECYRGTGLVFGGERLCAFFHGFASKNYNNLVCRCGHLGHIKIRRLAAGSHE